MTGMDAEEVVLMRVAGDPSAVHQQAALIAKDLPGVSVRDITQARRLIGSSLTAIDLRGLTRLELSYAVVLAACASGLVLALGVLERRRAFAVMAALGAKRWHLLAFLRSEALLVFVVGASLGALIGTVVAWMLVKLLTGAFDPPPEQLTVPWFYLGILFVSVAASVAVAVGATERRVEVSPVQLLRETA